MNVKKIKKIKKLQELEHLFELERLEDLRNQIKLLEKKIEQLKKEADRKLKFFEGKETIEELAVIGKNLLQLKKDIESVREHLEKQENIVKELHLKIKAVENYIGKMERDFQKIEEKKELSKNSLVYLLKRSYGKFLLLLFASSLITNASGQNSTLPYTDKLIKPYLEIQNRDFERLADKLLKGFQALEKKEQQLEEKKKFLLSKEEELKKLILEAQNLEEARQKKISKQVEKLVKILEKSDPDSAGEILSKMDPKLAAEILVELPKVRIAGEILSSMEPDAAAEVISVLLTQKKKTQFPILRKKIEEILKYAEDNSF